MGAGASNPRNQQADAGPKYASEVDAKAGKYAAVNRKASAQLELRASGRVHAVLTKNAPKGGHKCTYRSSMRAGSSARRFGSSNQDKASRPRAVHVAFHAEVGYLEGLHGSKKPSAKEQAWLIERLDAQSELFKQQSSWLKAALAGAMFKIPCKAGEVLIKQADEDGGFCYVVASGQFDLVHESHVARAGGAPAAADAGAPPEELLGTVEKGRLFGELALLYHTVRSCTVRAKVASQAWALSAAAYHRVVASQMRENARESQQKLVRAWNLGSLLCAQRGSWCATRLAFLLQVGALQAQLPFFSRAPTKLLRELANGFEPVSVPAGQPLPSGHHGACAAGGDGGDGGDGVVYLQTAEGGVRDAQGAPVPASTLVVLCPDGQRGALAEEVGRAPPACP